MYDAKTASIGYTTSTAVQEIRVPSRGMRQTDVHMVSVMSRYIDADALIESIKNTADLGGWIGEALYQIKQVAIKYIDSAPSIDIVRCKECRWQSVITDEEEGTYYMCGIWTMPTDEDVFCSYGKRREQ